MAQPHLDAVPGLEVAIWTPSSWPEIEKALKKQKPLTRLSRESSGAITSVVGYEQTTR